MPDDVRSLRLSMSVDGNQAVAASINALAGTTEAATAKISTSFQAATTASESLSREFAQSISSYRGAALAADDFGASMGKVVIKEEEVEFSSTEARHALRGMGEEMGIHMPRFISSFIADLGGVGPALASAFSVVAVIGIAQIIAEQLPEAYHKLEGAMTGWDENAKKVYDDVLKENDKYAKAVQKLALDLKNVGASGAEAAKNNAADAKQTIEDLGSRLSTVNKELDHLRDIQAQAEAEFLKFGNRAALMSVDQDKIAEAVKRQEEAQKALNEAVLKYNDLKNASTVSSKEEIVKDAKTAEEERVKVTAKALQKQAEEYRQYDAIIRSIGNANQRYLESEDKKAEEERVRIVREGLQKQEAELRGYEGVVRHIQDEQNRAYEHAGEEEIKLGNEVFQQAVQDAIKEGEAKERAHQKELDDYARLQLQIAQTQKQMLNRMDQEFGSHVTAWVTGQETISKALTGSWNAIATSVIQSVIRMGEAELVGLLKSKLINKEGVMISAKTAAAHTFSKVMQSVPFPLDFVLAPIAAAGAFAGVTALASFDKGGIMDENNMAMLHKKEMVLDPALSTFVQNAARNAGSNAGSGDGGGAHLTYAPTIYGGDPGALKDILRQHKDEIFQIVRNGVRHGNLKFGGM